MPDYLTLCAFRLGLLPVACGACAWWQTTGGGPRDAEVAGEQRRQWMVGLEPTWGSTGLLLAGNGPAPRAGSTSDIPAVSTPEGSATAGAPAVSDGQSPPPVIVASINYAPATAVPRLRDLPFPPLPLGAVLLFCLRSEANRGRSQAKRLLHKALAQLKERDTQEVYAVASLTGGHQNGDRCEFFSLEFLEANGFQRVYDDGNLFLMRADLRGLLSLISQVEAAVRRILRQDPTPSPAAWTRRGSS
ncbi:MAG: hypothetical protein V1912_13280 [bacterium]